MDKKSGGKDKTLSLGNMQDKWDRRWFVLSANGTLTYYKKEEDIASGVAAAGSLDCRGGSFGRFDDTNEEPIFTMSTRGRVLTMRAASDAEVASWAQVLAPMVALRDPGAFAPAAATPWKIGLLGKAISTPSSIAGFAKKKIYKTLQKKVEAKLAET